MTDEFDNSQEPCSLHGIRDQHGKTIGYNVDPKDRERWDAPGALGPPKKPRPAQKPRPLDELISDLDRHADISGPLEASLRSAYAIDPVRTTRTANAIVQDADAGRLTNPAGVLVVKLRTVQ